MQLVRGIHNIKHKHRRIVLTIGNFDGVHLGHQQILRALKARAVKTNALACVMLFEPQPQERLVSGQLPARLCTLREKLLLLESAGVDMVLCQRFSDKFRQLTAEAFVQQVLVEKLAIVHLMVGDDFRFGCDRKGSFSMLRKAAEYYGFSLTQTRTVTEYDLRISSTRIREALKNADLNQAEMLLGHPYMITGRIIKGRQLGRTLGIPTANFHLKQSVLPVSGVYAARVMGLEKPYLAVVNAGNKPTLGGCTPSLEAHLLDFEGELYGQYLTLELLGKVRDEKKFSSLEHLKQAIFNDIQFVYDNFSLNR